MNKATALIAAYIQELMEKHRMDGKAVLPYARIANIRTERMFGTIKYAIKRSVAQNGGE